MGCYVDTDVFVCLIMSELDNRPVWSSGVVMVTIMALYFKLHNNIM